MNTFSGIVLFSLLLLPASTSRAMESQTALPEPYVQCAAPLLLEGDEVERYDQNGYGIEIDGERYFLVYSERATFSLVSADKGTPVAHLKIDHSPSKFDEQARWRERWMQDIAKRSDVPLLRKATGKITILTVNKKALTGKNAGLSVLIDAPRKTFVQWEWANSANYTGTQDVATLQLATWKKVVPCLEK